MYTFIAVELWTNNVAILAAGVEQILEGVCVDRKCSTDAAAKSSYVVWYGSKFVARRTSDNESKIKNAGEDRKIAEDWSSTYV